MSSPRNLSPARDKGAASPVEPFFAQPTVQIATHQWVPDSDVQRCENPECHAEFSFVNRKHHCRECGHIFCNNCAPKRQEVYPPCHLEPVRLCGMCNRRLRFTREREPMMTQGAVFMKHGRVGLPHKRYVKLIREGANSYITWTDPQTQARVESIPIMSLRTIAKGQTTEVFQRSGSIGKDHLTLSLVAEDRTLDLECESQEMRDAWLKLFEEALLVLPYARPTDLSIVRRINSDTGAVEKMVEKDVEERLAARRAERKKQQEEKSANLAKKYGVE